MSGYKMVFGSGRFHVVDTVGTLTVWREGKLCVLTVETSAELLVAMAERVQALETAIRTVLDGPAHAGRRGRAESMAQFDISKLHHVHRWEDLLRGAVDGGAARRAAQSRDVGAGEGGQA